MSVTSMLGFNAFDASAAPGGAKGHVSSESIRVVLLVAVPFAAAGLVQFVNSW